MRALQITLHCESVQHSGQFAGWHLPWTVVSRNSQRKKSHHLWKDAILRTVTCSSTHCDGLQSSGTACDSMAWWSHEDSSLMNVVKKLIKHETWNSWSACPSTSAFRKCSTCLLSRKHYPHPTTKFTRTLFLDFLSSKIAKESFYINYLASGIPL